MNSTRIKMTPMIKDKMVEIPKGTIELRDDRTKEKWTVEIESFLLFKFPVTQDFYFEITNENRLSKYDFSKFSLLSFNTLG